MSRNVDLSIIIPHYNSPDYLKILLDSIGKNDGVEIIVVDDYSSRQLLEYERLRITYSDRVIFLKNEGTKSAGAARNVGLRVACGRWLLFADADDYFLPQWYDKVKKYFETDFDTIYFRPISKNILSGENEARADGCNKLINDYIDNKKGSETNLKYEWVTPWSKMIKRSVIEKNDVNFEEIFCANDVMFSIKVAYYTKSVGVSCDSIYCITSGASILTVNNSQYAHVIRAGALCRRYLFLKEHGIMPPYWLPLLILRAVYLSTNRDVAKAVLNEYRKNGVPVLTFKMLTNMKPLWERLHVKIRKSKRR